MSWKYFFCSECNLTALSHAPAQQGHQIPCLFVFWIPLSSRTLYSPFWIFFGHFMFIFMLINTSPRPDATPTVSIVCSSCHNLYSIVYIYRIYAVCISLQKLSQWKSKFLTLMQTPIFDSQEEDIEPLTDVLSSLSMRSCLNITDVSLARSGQYVCHVHEGVGEHTASVSIDITVLGKTCRFIRFT